MTHNTQYHRIANTIRRKIHNGEYTPGQQLPPRHTLADQYGVSEVTITKITTILRNEGLIETRAGKGTYVTTQPSQDTIRHIANELRNIQFQLGPNTIDNIRRGQTKIHLTPEECENLARALLTAQQRTTHTHTHTQPPTTEPGWHTGDRIEWNPDGSHWTPGTILAVYSPTVVNVRFDCGDCDDFPVYTRHIRAAQPPADKP